MRSISVLFLAMLSATFLLTACSGDNSDQASPLSGNTTSNSSSAPARKTIPDDPQLKTLYTQSCFSCHGTGAAGAPRTGSNDWQPRLAKGMDVLLDHTLNGFNAMPPKGLCMNCSEDDYRNLIHFMSGAK